MNADATAASVSISADILRVPPDLSSASEAAALEAYLARLYTDPSALAGFLAAPRESARRAGLLESVCDALTRLDPVNLSLAANSFTKKRAARGTRAAAQGR